MCMYMQAMEQNKNTHSLYNCIIFFFNISGISKIFWQPCISLLERAHPLILIIFEDQFVHLVRGYVVGYTEGTSL